MFFDADTDCDPDPEMKTCALCYERVEKKDVEILLRGVPYGIVVLLWHKKWETLYIIISAIK